MRLNELLPVKLCINLDRRADRWERMQERFARHQVTGAERFAAIDGQDAAPPPGWPWSAGQYGCLLSHQAAVREAQRRGLPAVLVFEDDVDFDPDLQAKFDRFTDPLPADWDILLLGAIHQDEPVRISDHLLRLTRSNSAHAYAVSAKAYAAFLELNERLPDAIDTNMTRLQQTHHCYCCFPHLAWVAADFSDTRQKSVNPGWLGQSLILCGREMDEVLGDSALLVSCCTAGRSAAWLAGCRQLIESYRRHFPEVDLVVIEQGDRARRGAAFDAGAALAEERNLLFFLDSEVYVAPRDVRANLMMARRHDLVSACGSLYQLGPAESARLLSGVGRVDGTPDLAVPDAPLGSACCAMTRQAFERLGGWVASRLGESEEALHPARAAGLSVFTSPNPALRLDRG